MAPGPEVTSADRRSVVEWVAYGLGLAVLGFAGFYGELLAAFIAAHSENGWLVWLPVGGYVAAMLVGLGGGVYAFVQRRTPWAYLAYAGGLLLVTMIAGVFLAQL